MRTLLMVSAALLAAVGGRVSAQNPPTPQQPVFRTATRLIQVSVVVHDGRKQPVPGLRAEDFQVFEEGKEQPVAFFTAHTKSTPAMAAEQGVFTNRVQGPSGGGVVAIVYDQLNTAQLDQQRVREHLVKFLAKVNPDDRIGLYVLNSRGMAVLHDFTRDARSLLRILGGVQPPSSVARDAANERGSDVVGFGDAIDRRLEEFVRTGEANMRGFFQRQLALQSIDAMESVAKHLAGVQGRKNLIWVSSGFPFQFRAYGPGTAVETMSTETARAARALNDADVAVYGIDARGLVGAFASPPGAREPTFTTIDTVQKPIEGLRQFAQLTGGEAYFNSNDLGAAIARAVDDSRLTYTIGYYSEQARWDGKFRRISVKVRRKDVDVRHRAGYYAIPPGSIDKLPPRTAAIDDALASPLEATGLTISVSAERGDAGRVTLAIQFEPGTPLLESQGAIWQGGVDIAIAQTMPPGTQTVETDITIPLTLDIARREQLLKDGLRLTRTITLREDAHEVRVVARDASTGATGSVIIPASTLRR